MDIRKLIPYTRRIVYECCFLKRKIILKTVMFITFLFIVGTLTKSFGMKHYYKAVFSTGLVMATKLNARSGTGRSSSSGGTSSSTEMSNMNPD